MFLYCCRHSFAVSAQPWQTEHEEPGVMVLVIPATSLSESMLLWGVIAPKASFIETDIGPGDI